MEYSSGWYLDGTWMVGWSIPLGVSWRVVWVFPRNMPWIVPEPGVLPVTVTGFLRSYYQKKKKCPGAL
jgi:hypothetical protein